MSAFIAGLRKVDREATALRVATRPQPVELAGRPVRQASTVARVSSELAALDDPDPVIRRRLWDAYSQGYDCGSAAALEFLPK